jgi:hypothetical protein
MEEMPLEENPFYQGGKKKVVECKHCNERFEAWEYTLDTDRFCSKDCFDDWQIESGHLSGENNPNYNGGPAKYGPGWNETKKEMVRERDGRKCQNCGLSEARHVEVFGERHTVHHIIKARVYDDPEKRNHPDNLITLCKGKCHRKWEAMSPLRPVE